MTCDGLDAASDARVPKPATLVLLPGSDGTGLMFGPFIAALGGRVPVVTVSYPMHGPQGYADLQKVAALALPDDGPVVLLGESFSGPIAIALAAAHPTRVVGVVLCCTFVRNPRPGLRWLRGLDALPLPVPPRAVVEVFLFGRFATAGLRRLLRDALGKVSPSVLRARLLAVVTVDVREQARTLAMPVLYLQAESDRIVPPCAGVEVGQCCGRMTIQSFDAPHALLQTAPVKAAEAVVLFIDAKASARREGSPFCDRH